MARLFQKLFTSVSSLKPLEAGRAGECWVGEGAPESLSLGAPGEGWTALCALALHTGIKGFSSLPELWPRATCHKAGSKVTHKSWVVKCRELALGALPFSHTLPCTYSPFTN